MSTTTVERPNGVAKSEPEINTRIAQYVKLRDIIKAKQEVHKAELAPLNDALIKLNQRLLDLLDSNGGDSVAVKGVGTVYRTVKSSATIADGEVFRNFVIGEEHWDMIDWRANAPTVAEFITEKGEAPPGVNFRQYAVVGVRRGKGDE